MVLYRCFIPVAVFIAKNAVLSSFALGRQTSLVVDAGHESTVGTCFIYIVDRIYTAVTRLQKANHHIRSFSIASLIC